VSKIEGALHTIPTASIIIGSDRQRQEHDDKEDDQLFDSIQQYGLIHPILLQKDGDQTKLVVGERRLRVWRQLERIDPDVYGPGIPARFIEELDEDERIAVELHENIRRKSLHWKEECLAFLRYHETKERMEEDEWTFGNSAHDLNCSNSHVRRMCSVAQAILAGDEAVLAADSARAANAILERRTKRNIENELMTFGEAEATEVDVDEGEEPTDAELQEIELEGLEEVEKPEGHILVEPGTKVGKLRTRIVGPQGIRSAENDITVTNFLDVASSYDGPKFNFVHCDFPYGIGLHESDQVNVGTRDVQYEDTEEIFWECCRTLAMNKEKLMSRSCHLLFWFPMKNYETIREFFTAAEFRVDPYPLVWMKSDKVGILPDANRGPRRIYETAFIMSLGDRKIIKPTVNAVHFPSEKRGAEHVSLKPYTVLSEFMTMFIDSESVVLDPTCGTGTALAVATRKHAKAIVGWDIDSKAVELAISEVNSARLHIEVGAQKENG
jgi:ParB-like chromosome segregation protein Spo0J